jgi:hypothetical protein
VIAPVDETIVATVGRLLTQVPPVGNAVNDEAPPIHRVVGPAYVVVGLGITVADTGSDGQLEPVAV